MSKVVQLIQDGEDVILPIDPQDCDELGWKVGDSLNFKDNGDGSFTISKIKEDFEYVLISTMSIFRQNYVVKVPRGKMEWALDTVATQEATEFSQEHLTETIFDNRVISRDELNKMFRDEYPNSRFDADRYVTEVKKDGSVFNGRL